MAFYKRAIVKKPSPSIEEGIKGTDIDTPPHYREALRQHHTYVETLKECGLHVEELEADEAYPDSTFVEDTAVVTERVAVITRLGHSSRQGEEEAIKESLQSYFKDIEEIRPPGTLEGGDVLQVEDTFFIGVSKRTNLEGAEQLKEILSTYEYRSHIIHHLPPNLLHLKSGLSYLGENILLMTRDFCGEEPFKEFTSLHVPDEERYAANSLRINAYVLVPEGYDKTRVMIQDYYQVKTIDTSSFRKLDGGLSCLSLRF